MNLLLIHQAFVSSKEAGGTRHSELARQLADRGLKLKVVTSLVSYLTNQSVTSGGATAKGLLYSREDVEGVTVIRARTPAVLHKGFGWRILSFLVFAVTSVWAGLRSGPVDIVMGTTPPIFQAPSAWLVARLRRKPFLLEVRDLWPDFAIDMGVLRNPLVIRAARLLERFLYRAADRIIVNSPAYRDYLLEKGIAPEKIAFVPNGVDVEMFQTPATGTAIRERFGLQDKVVVVYAGAHGMANDLRTVLAAADRLRSVETIHFLFVGDGKEKANLEAEAQRLALPNVTFAGSIPKDQMPEVLAAADLCLATLMNIKMFSMTYPNKVFDYMAAGRPTVLGIDGVIRKVIEDSDGGLYVPPGDAPALSDAIDRLAADPDRRRAMGARARDYVATHFNRRDQALEFFRVLESLG